MKQAATSWLQTLRTDVFCAGIQALVPGWVKWLTTNGDWVKVWCVPPVTHVPYIYMSKSKYSSLHQRVCYLTFWNSFVRTLPYVNKTSYVTVPKIIWVSNVAKVSHQISPVLLIYDKVHWWSTVNKAFVWMNKDKDQQYPTTFRQCHISILHNMHKTVYRVHEKVCLWP